MLFTTLLSAQAPDTLWTRTYGGVDNELAFSVVQTVDEGYILVGRTLPNVGDQDLWIVKTNPLGDTTWTKRYGDDIDDEIGRSIQQTFDNGYIITGSKGSNLWLLKTDNSGDTSWTKQFKRDDYSYGYDVKQTSDSGYVLVGRTQQGSGQNFRDLWLIKTDILGDTIWTKVYGGSEEDVGYSVNQTFDGGYIVAGETQSFGHGEEDVWLIKTDAMGDTIWTKTFGRTLEDVGWSDLQTPDSGYVITGETESNSTYIDVYLIKTNKYGDTLWTKTYDRGDNEIGYSIVETPDNGFAICSDFNYNVWLLRTNNMGDTLWTTSFGNYSYLPFSLKQTKDNGYIVAGGKSHFERIIDFSLIKYAPDPVLGIKKDNIVRRFELFQNYSNPFNPNTKIEFDVNQTCVVTLKIYDLQGRSVSTLIDKKMNPGNYKVNFNAGNLASGIYFYRIKIGDYTATKKMILNR